MNKIYAAWLFAGRIKDGQFFYQQTRVFVLAENVNEAHDIAVDKLNEKLIVSEGDFVDIKLEMVPESWYTLNAGIEEITGNVPNPKHIEEYPEVSVQVM